MKRCYRCGNYWPDDTENFYRNLTKTDGLSDECRSCTREMARERYHGNLDRARARGRTSMARQRNKNREVNLEKLGLLA